MQREKICAFFPEQNIPLTFKNENRSNRLEARKFGGYFFAPVEVNDLAEEIIASYHPHLKKASIAYLFRAGRWKSRGRTITGRAVVASPLWRCLSGFDLVLILNEAIYGKLDNKGKRALLDYELSHFIEQEAGSIAERSWATREHDVREFSDVVKRHGICFSNLSALTNSARQLDLESLQEKADDTSDDEEEIGADVFTQDLKEEISPDRAMNIEEGSIEEEENLFYEEPQ